MISIDRFEEILSDLAEEIPQSFYEELNGGIVVEPGYLLHPEDRSGTLYVMGQYRIDPAMGKYIVMYYGSFKRAYRHLDEDELTEEMRKVLRHEFRHHVEGRAGVRDLEVWDAEQIARYKEQQAENHPNETCRSGGCGCRETPVSPTSRNGPQAVPKSYESSSRWSKLSSSGSVKSQIHAPAFYEFAQQILFHARCRAAASASRKRTLLIE